MISGHFHLTNHLISQPDPAPKHYLLFIKLFLCRISVILFYRLQQTHNRLSGIIHS